MRRSSCDYVTVPAERWPCDTAHVSKQAALVLMAIGAVLVLISLALVYL